MNRLVQLPLALLLTVLVDFSAGQEGQTTSSGRPMATLVRLPQNLQALDDKLPGKTQCLKIDGREAFLITPNTPSAGSARPWVWYAPTLSGQHPDTSHLWMFEQFLSGGIFIAGIDVGESMGNPQGRQSFTSFHHTLSRDFGLSAKACLLPQSRGGLMLYNWAVEHPEHVARIAGIYTVCNLSSWPGLQSASPAYGMTPQQLAAVLNDHNPIQRLAPLAHAGVPILHIHGDSDSVVPLQDNSAELQRRYRAQGGKMKLIVVPGKGHQVLPEFFHCRELLEFVIGDP